MIATSYNHRHLWDIMGMSGALTPGEPSSLTGATMTSPSPSYIDSLDARLDRNEQEEISADLGLQITPPTVPSCAYCGSSCPVPYGHCHCGCGQTTRVSTVNMTWNGDVRGKHKRFLKGHCNRLRTDTAIAVPFKIDCVYCRLIPLTKGQSPGSNRRTNGTTKETSDDRR
jgi:hypothetical protein